VLVQGMSFLILISGLFFYSFFVLICVENTALALVAFVLNLLFGVLILFFAGVEFLSFAFLLVYLGAISVLFIFALLFLKLDAKKVPHVFSFDSFSLIFLVFLMDIFFYLC
jgi:NADH-ubiquinone oxidoreductase chain 6